jgi:hypothetical protein
MNQRRAWTLSIALSLPTLPALAADLPVDQGRTYPQIERAMDRAAPDDTIPVYPQADGKPYKKTAVFVDKVKIAFRSAPQTREAA